MLLAENGSRILGEHLDSEFILKGYIYGCQFLGWKFELTNLSGVESIHK
jgi:hypothetical protein